jgi:5-formyltetrahydrofolate cyclo-ligase
MESSEKALLRAKLKAARPHSSAGLTQQLSQLLTQYAPTTLASYWPLESEPDTAEFNRLAMAAGVRLITPRIRGELEFAVGEVTPGEFGISEPTGDSVALSEADLILVPALAVDTRGNRLGKGKGYYDRALIGTSAPRFAVVFEQEFLPTIPTELHDQPVTGLVTPKAIRIFH